MNTKEYSANPGGWQGQTKWAGPGVLDAPGECVARVGTKCTNVLLSSAQKPVEPVGRWTFSPKMANGNISALLNTLYGRYEEYGFYNHHYKGMSIPPLYKPTDGALIAAVQRITNRTSQEVPA